MLHKCFLNKKNISNINHYDWGTHSDFPLFDFQYIKESVRFVLIVLRGNSCLTAL